MGYCALHYQDHQHDLIDHVEEMRREEEARGCPPPRRIEQRIRTHAGRMKTKGGGIALPHESREEPPCRPRVRVMGNQNTRFKNNTHRGTSAASTMRDADAAGGGARRRRGRFAGQAGEAARGGRARAEGRRGASVPRRRPIGRLLQCSGSQIQWFTTQPLAELFTSAVINMREPHATRHRRSRASTRRTRSAAASSRGSRHSARRRHS